VALAVTDRDQWIMAVPDAGEMTVSPSRGYESPSNLGEPPWVPRNQGQIKVSVKPRMAHSSEVTLA
jgi:hypothetical protein